MSRTVLSLWGAAIWIFPGLLNGGTIITANLPANSAIVNIDGRSDGAAGFNGTQSQWFRPFNTGGTLLEYTIQPGAYQFRVVDPTDSAALYPALTAPQLSTIFTAWSFNSPFVTDYLVFDVSAATNAGVSQLLAGAISPSGTSTAASAYALAKTSGYFNQVTIGDITSGSKVTRFTFSAAETLIFAVPDNLLSDNQAGVSVLISPVNASDAPEPGSMALLLAGAGALGLAAKRRLRTAAPAKT